MTDLSNAQSTLKASITKRAAIWGVIVTLLTGGIAYWLAFGLGALIAAPLASAVGAALGFLTFRGIFSAGAREAQCAQCGAAFSVTETGRAETLRSAEPMSRIESTPAVTDAAIKGTKSGAVPPVRQVTTWIEETYDVVIETACRQCSAVNTRSIVVTRQRDRETREHVVAASRSRT